MSKNITKRRKRIHISFPFGDGTGVQFTELVFRGVPIAIFYKDGWSGEGVGYYVWEVENGKLKHQVADINLGAAKRPDGA